MKTIKIQILLAAALMGNISSMHGMERFVQMVKGHNFYPAVSAAIKQRNVYPGQDCPRTMFSFTGKGKTQQMLDTMRAQAKKGILPSRSDIKQLMSFSKINNYSILNQHDDEGHTLLNDIVISEDHPNRKKCLKALYEHGAQLSNRDTYAMEPELLLKSYLNVSPNATSKTTIKVLRTFKTKNTPEKLASKLSLGKMTQLQVDARFKKSVDIDMAYNAVKHTLE